jgi:hypothetical protein
MDATLWMRDPIVIFATSCSSSSKLHYTYKMAVISASLGALGVSDYLGLLRWIASR